MRRAVAIVIAGLVGATACAPGPAPAPNWVTSRLARTTTATTTTNQVGAWTDDDWGASLEIQTVTGGGGTATLQFFPRSGAGNATLGTPQRLPLSISPTVLGPIGEHIVAVSGSAAVEFFRETGGVWASAGLFALPSPTSQLAAMSDRWMAVRNAPTSPGAGDNTVRVYSIDATGPTVVPTFVTSLGPDPSWPTELREGFGTTGVALDGDLIAVGAQGLFAPTPGGARVFRYVSGSWTAVQSFGALATGPIADTRTIAVDDGPLVDRLAIAPQADLPNDPVVNVFADTGSGFVLEQTITRDPSLPDTYNGALFGSAIGLDGDLLAVVARGVAVPSAEPGHTDVTIGYVQLFRKGATWTREAEVTAITAPAPPDVTVIIPMRLQVHANHVAATVLASPDPPSGCSFPCFVIGFEAWSIDRTN